MKVVILGIDGLEYGLVEKWNLKNLKQKEYGKVKVPISQSIKKPHSAQVWASFLIGKEYEEIGFNNPNPINRIYNKLNLKKITPEFFKKFVKSKTDNIKSFPKLEEKKFTEEGFETYNVPFIDLIEPEALKKYDEWSTNKITSLEFKDFLENMYKKDKKNIKYYLRQSKNNFFGFTNFFDHLQHHFYMDKNYIKEKYEDIDKFVGEIKKKLPKDTLLLVISDHGTDMKGGHSNHAFYSVNKKLGLKNPHISDFYDIIMKGLKLPTNKDKKQIEQNLKKLGYI